MKIFPEQLHAVWLLQDTVIFAQGKASDELPVIGRLSFFGFIRLLIFSNIRNEIIQQIEFDRLLQLLSGKGNPGQPFLPQPPATTSCR